MPCAQRASLRPFTLDPTVPERIGLDLVPHLAGALGHVVVGGEVVLFDPGRGTSTLLNRTAALIWASIDGRASVATIVEELAAATGADPAVVEADVRDALARFVDAGVVDDPFGAGDEEAAPGGTGEGSGALGAAAPDARGREGSEPALDGPAWVLDERRRCSGALVAVRTDDADVADRLRPALAVLPADPGAHDPVATVTVLGPDGDGRGYRVLRDTVAVGSSSTADDAVDRAFTELNDLAIHHTPDRVVLHAGAVERGGAVVVVAGASGRGKSTLTAALVRHGWRYLSDEVVAIDPATLGVLPYPKPLDLDPAACHRLGLPPPAATRGKGKVPVDRVGRAGDGTGAVALLVLLADPATPWPAERSPAEVVVELLANTFAPTSPTAASAQERLDRVAALAAAVPALWLDRLPVDDAVAAVDQRVRSGGR